MPKISAFPNLQPLLREALGGLELRKKRVSFLLGSDVGIHHEARVALTPKHVVQLREDLQGLGLELDLLVHAGAGERARQHGEPGFGDEEYSAAGARIVEPGELADGPSLDVLHALKEPTEYESDIKGPMLRIGALHLASKPPGVCRLLGSKSFAAIFDGGTIGNCSYLKFGSDRTPIVGSMSRFAGAVAGRKLIEGMTAGGHRRGKVVVVGGGIAGRAAIRKLDPKVTELVVVEISPALESILRQTLDELGFTGYRIIDRLSDEALTDAVGIIFAHRSGAKAAEKVCRYEQIQKMRRGAAIADIAIDQGGSILHDGYCETDDAATSRRKYQVLLQEYSYYAETNMPREEPREASEMHGDASLPYVTLLLALSAHLGGPEAVVEHLLRFDHRIYHAAAEVDELDLIAGLSQDLRNGLQLAVRHGEVAVVDEDIQRDQALMSWIAQCSG